MIHEAIIGPITDMINIIIHILTEIEILTTNTIFILMGIREEPEIIQESLKIPITKNNSTIQSKFTEMGIII